jgi:antitoxin (DNA-binding transcriptional repressor) of toxin-antitoxin stability system
MSNATEKSPAPRQVGVREFRGNLNAFLKEVQAGQSFVLTSHHKAVAEIRPPSSALIARMPGALRGKIRLAPDFDAELPADIVKAMESDA